MSCPSRGHLIEVPGEWSTWYGIRHAVQCTYKYMRPLGPYIQILEACLTKACLVETTAAGQLGVAGTCMVHCTDDEVQID